MYFDMCRSPHISTDGDARENSSPPPRPVQALSRAQQPRHNKPHRRIVASGARQGATRLMPAMVGPAAETRSSPTPDDDDFRRLVESHQRAVRVHCYRMLGSLEDAEDVTQETFLRAWRRLNEFEGRAALRTWLYRIATNACLDELERRGRRLLPPMLGAPTRRFDPREATVGEAPWLEPFPDAWLEVPDTSPGPEARYETKEAIELAFVAALQRLVPRQRAVLILRDVLGWSAKDVA